MWRHHRSLALALVALLAATSQAQAGPWPRGEGETFLSFSGFVTTPMDQIGADTQGFASVYLERGMRHELTFGLDAGVAEGGAFSAFVFMKKPDLKQSETHRFALRLGAGASGEAGEIQDATAVFGAYWGRGFTSRFGSGWATLDVQAHYGLISGDVIAKADATIGIKPNDRLKVMMQLQTGDYPGADPFLRLAPSVAWALTEGHHIELGGQVGLIGDDRVGLKIGTWLEF
jgi:hypothetical protein